VNEFKEYALRFLISHFDDLDDVDLLGGFPSFEETFTLEDVLVEIEDAFYGRNT
jgi:hypothetical protein